MNWPSNIACYLPKVDVIVLLKLMSEVDAYREAISRKKCGASPQK